MTITKMENAIQTEKCAEQLEKWADKIADANAALLLATRRVGTIDTTIEDLKLERAELEDTGAPPEDLDKNAGLIANFTDRTFLFAKKVREFAKSGNFRNPAHRCPEDLRDNHIEQSSGCSCVFVVEIEWLG